MRHTTRSILVTSCLAITPPLAAQDILLSRVVDVGAGLCVVTIAPGEPRSAVMVYDVNSGCADEIDDMIVQDTIDLLVISHSDADHLRDADDLLRDRPIKIILRTGSRRAGATNFDRMENRIGDETKAERASVINLATFPLTPGTGFPLGDATVTFVAGWPEWTLTNLQGGEANNAVSIVVRLEYDGRSILFGGDTVGRHIGDPANTCDHAEAAMVNGPVPLASDVLIAPHHGADNGSSTCFIGAVDPTFVIFSAGSQFGHPRDSTAQRYLTHGVDSDHMFRTDRGDDEDGDEGPLEWKHWSVTGCQDGKGDDDVDIVIVKGGSLSVAYLHPPPLTGC